MTEPLRRACKGCGCPLIFVTGPNGKIIPLDERAQVYRLGKDLMGEPVAEVVAGAYVTHYASCPKASDFSKGKRR
jgi:hypothetical protein